MRNKAMVKKNLLLSLSMVLVLTGCQSESGKERTVPASIETAMEKQTDDSQTEDSQTEDSQIEDNKTEHADAPVFNVELQSEFLAEDKECFIPVISGEGFETAAKAIAAWGEAEKNDMASTPVFTYLNTKCTRADQQIISFKAFIGYDGDGRVRIVGCTFDAESGQKLELDHILTDPEKFNEKSWEYLKENLDMVQKQDLNFEENEERLAQLWNPEQRWYLSASGITLILEPSDFGIGPYDMYSVEFTIPYEALEKEIDSKYRSLSGAGVGVLAPKAHTITGFGTEIFLETIADAQGDSGWHIVLKAGDSQTELEEIIDRIVSAYLISREDGREFVIFTGDYASDDYGTFVYEVTDGKIRRVQDEISGACIAAGDVSTKNITLNQSLNVLGSYTSPMLYHIEGDGRLTASSDYYDLSEMEWWNTLKIIKPLPVTINGKETELPVDTQITLTGTDNQGIVSFYVTDTGETGEIHFIRSTEDGWSIIEINGVSEFDYFEMLPYVG